ncbi:DUF559 domain-containing protein [Adhaeribacter pallidiroseus]|uniref:DUF559 domain-containing protein n=1 Tax=Adhaeribacter pallidiroseus TaxID=2072847 RepID=A0A369QNE6_9BACT|nr:DUF559 domain-containing protein [Adhaeribacter pallidiroseus]RDC63738.1 hypothetical protein AHMF7616_02346 [Adhaeribacter pallidiroseus]
MVHNCIECGSALHFSVLNYSTSNFGVPLCRNHQDWIRSKSSQTTNETIDLYFALKQRGVPAELEKFDGYKTIDIAVTDAKVNIEVDGGHHIYDQRQALADLKRTYYSFLKGFLTLRIPNTLIHCNLEETANYLTDFLIQSKNNKYIQ